MPNDGVFYTVKLNIKRIQEEEDFIDDSFNAVIDDIDNKVVGISHLTSGAHWHIWEADTAYNVGDVIRWPAMKSHQYAKCIQAGTTSSTRPAVNVTGSEVLSGTTKWKIVSLTSTSDANGGVISIWQGGGVLYERGDAVLYASSLYRCKVASHYSSNTFEDDKDNWQEVYASIRPWEDGKFYYENDVVIVDLELYKCLEDHTSANSFNLPAEKARWAYIGDYANVYEWTPSTYYIKNQLVTIQDILYRSLYTHTSDANDIVNDMDFWEPIYASIQSWSAGSYYGAGVVILANNRLYRCIASHIAENTFTLDADNWLLMHTPPSIVEDWSITTAYSQYQVVKYDGNLYRALYGHTSDLDFDPTKWELLTDSVNDWVTQGTYVVGQYVNYQNVLYKCLVANDDSSFTPAKWQRVGGGGIDTWATNTDYTVGAIVVNNNKIYQCNTAHTSSNFNSDASNWTEISACITRIPNWEVDTDYVVGDLVAYDSKIYRCTTAHTSDTTAWNSTEEANWEELSPTINEISTWTVSTDYAVGQLVIHDNKLYRCNTNHTSDSTSFNTDIAYWDSIGASGIDAWKIGEAYQQGSMVVYNDKIYICDTAHTSTSTFDPTKWHEVSTNDIALWQISTDYYVGDIVIKDNQLYRCVTNHTSGTFTTDISNWAILDTKWIAKNWATSTYYAVGETVLYENTIYKCTTAHTSANSFSSDASNWKILNANIRYWESGKVYRSDEIVVYDNKLWRCVANNTSNLFDKSQWNMVPRPCIEVWKSSASNNGYLGIFHFDDAIQPDKNSVDGSTYGFSHGNLVLADGNYGKYLSQFSSIAGFPPALSFDPLPFTNGTEVYTIEFWLYMTHSYNMAGIAPEGYPIIYNEAYAGVVSFTHFVFNFNSGSMSSQYTCNAWHHFAFIISSSDIKMYADGKLDGTYTRSSQGASTYLVANFNNASSLPVHFDEIYISNIARYTSDFDIDDWNPVEFNYEGYQVNDLVVYRDRIYRCITANNDSTFNASKWKEVGLPGAANIPNWEQSISYKIGDTVLYDGKVYRCNTAHTSSSTFTQANWTPINNTLDNWATGKNYYVGEVVKYNNKLWRCLTTHQSESTEPPADAVLYEATGNVIEVDDTTTIPYTETIDLGDIYNLTDIDYTESTTEMSFTYTIEISTDNSTYDTWDGSGSARYIKLTVDSVSIDSGATSPNAYLSNFKVYGDSDKWELISSGGGGSLVYATNQDIDNLFI